MPLGVNDIVFRIRGLSGRSKSDDVAVKLKIGRRSVAEEFIAVFYGMRIEHTEPRFRIVAVLREGASGRPIVGPIQTPFEGPDNTIIGPETEAVFPILH